MNSDSPTPIAHLCPLIVGVVVACGAGAAAGAFLASTDHPAAAWQPALLGAVPVAVGAALGVGVLLPASARTVRRMGMSVVAASAARLLTALAVMLAIFLVLRPPATPFFGAFVSGAAGCLIVETLWAAAALRRPVTSGATPA